MSYIGNAPISAAFLVDTFSGNGSTVAFTMTVAPANTSSIIVAITGVLQDPSTYSVSGTTLTFSAAPPSGTSNISVRYLGIPASGVTTTAYRTVTNFTATAGQTSFSVPSYTVGYIDVYRNGVRLVSTDYTATTGTTVVLNNACTVGDSVVTESFYVSSVLNAIPATAGSVSSSNLAALSTIPSTAGNITVPAATGTMQVSGNMPAFSAYLTTSQTLANGVNTLVQINAKNFDTATAFNNTGSTVTLNGLSVPAYAFMPPVSGYYIVTMATNGPGGTTTGQIAVNLSKTGSLYQQGNAVQNATFGVNSVGSFLVNLNGTTDYIQFYAQQSTGSSGAIYGSSSGIQYTYFSACLIRSA